MRMSATLAKTNCVCFHRSIWGIVQQVMTKRYAFKWRFYKNKLNYVSKQRVKLTACSGVKFLAGFQIWSPRFFCSKSKRVVLVVFSMRGFYGFCRALHKLKMWVSLTLFQFCEWWIFSRIDFLSCTIAYRRLIQSDYGRVVWHYGFCIQVLFYL